MAREVDALSKSLTVNVGGTKIQTNAGRHKAVSYRRAGKMMRKQVAEVAELAENADCVSLAAGLTFAGEIKRRKERKALLEAARKVMEERCREAKAERGKEDKTGKQGFGRQGWRGKEAVGGISGGDSENMMG